MLCAVAARYGHVDVGMSWNSIHAGLVRVFLAFFVGVALRRFLVSRPLGHAVPWWLTFTIAAASFVLDVSESYRGLYDVFCIVVLYPLVIVLASRDPVRLPPN